ncbi:MAG: 4-hydroxy-3-methylbut-2-enyl diphosphate reductase [Candidatus Shapirobacteria bacterium]|nr:4-hydroxy-3-methylbut-2-enyl diphosphate reductase [Candidatus Shapirobacteria bacterium]
MANIILAQPHGFCFGITRAIKLAQDTAKKYSNKPIYFFGELVHNQHVVDWLENNLNIKTVYLIDDIPHNSVVIIRAHGVAPEIYQQAKDRQLIIIDASCPLVLKSHQTVRQLVKQNKDIILLCNKIDHDETVGIVGEAPKSITPVTLTQIFDYQIKDPKNTIVLTQTTLSTTETQKAFDFLKNKYPQLTILPHICQATTERQQAIIKLAKKHHFVIIVGAPTSANSNSLRSVAESAGAISYIVDNVSELNPEWFTNQENIVISSGASTPQDILDEVIQKIAEITRR